MTRDEECELYWNSLNWSGRTKVLRKLELRTGMFNDAWKDLPRMVRERITRQWDTEEESGQQVGAGYGKDRHPAKG